MDWNALNLTLGIEKGRAKPKYTFKCSQAEPMQGNANQCCKKEERWKLVATAGNMKGGQRGLWKAHLDLLWLKVWAQSKVSDPLVDCDPLDCGAFKQKSQVLRLLVRSRSDQVRAMTNTMQSQYLATTFNLKVLYLNSPIMYVVYWCVVHMLACKRK